MILKWADPFVNLPRSFQALRAAPRFLRDWRSYRRMPGAEKITMRDAQPCLWDWTPTTAFDHHYLYQNAWAFRKIIAEKPAVHYDVGSEAGFVANLSAVVPVVFLDIRPLGAAVSGLESRKGSVLSLPFRDREIFSLSSLHVIEHIGLGRYGDPLNPNGTKEAIRELARVVAPDGNLYIGIPVGRPRVCFNAHRIHDPVDVLTLFHNQGLDLISFSCVDDSGTFIESCDPEEMKGQKYACGLYHFRRLAG